VLTFVELKAIFTSEGRIVKDGSTYKFEYNMKDHLGNVRVAFIGQSSGTPLVTQRSSYFPFGMVAEQTNSYSSGVLGNKFLYNGKELQDDDIAGVKLDWYDYGARFYDPKLGRWHVVDPLMETDRAWSPYNYTRNNPLRFIDPTGMAPEVYITGAKADKATNQLNSSTSLNITRDASTGKLSATGEAVSKSDKQLLAAIDSKDVTVNITADGSKTTLGPNGDNYLLVGGAFKGNTVTTETATETIDLGFEDAIGNITVDITTTSTTVSTEQHVNPDVLGALDAANGNSGQGMLHETIESYEGGVVSLKKGVSSPVAEQPGSVFNIAHRRAPSQGGNVTGKYWDAGGNPLPSATGAVKAEIKSNGQVIMRY